MFTQVADFITGWGVAFGNQGEIIGAFSIGLGWLLSRLR